MFLISHCIPAASESLNLGHLAAHALIHSYSSSRFIQHLKPESKKRHYLAVNLFWHCMPLARTRFISAWTTDLFAKRTSADADPSYFFKNSFNGALDYANFTCFSGSKVSRPPAKLNFLESQFWLSELHLVVFAVTRSFRCPSRTSILSLTRFKCAQLEASLRSALYESFRNCRCCSEHVSLAAENFFCLEVFVSRVSWQSNAIFFCLSIFI